MKRNKRRVSALKKVLFCSWCVLMLVSSFLIIKYAAGLSKLKPYEDADSVDAAGKPQRQPDTTTPGAGNDKEDTKTPVATPIPQAEFTEDYIHSGQSEEILAYEQGVAYGLRYPSYDIAAYREAVKAAAEELLAEKLKTASATEGTERKLVIDYEDGEAGELLSVLFHINIEIDGVSELSQVQWIYNKKKGEEIEADTLFTDAAYRYAAGLVNETDVRAEELTDSEGQETGELSGTREEFPEYLLTADGAKFFYESDGLRQSITIPYIELHTYMTVTVNGNVPADGIRELDPSKPMIAFTFDDGPHYIQTPRLLKILEENGARATFFVLGDRSFFTESNQKTVKLIYESGNELGSHTYSHQNLPTLSAEEIIEEVTKARENIFALTGEYPTFIRPPYGNVDDKVRKYTNAPLISWNLDSLDWKLRDTDKIVEQVLAEVANGRIVLMHDIYETTVNAVEVLLPRLIEDGYQIVTVRELLYYHQLELENGRVYHSIYN